MLNCVMDIDQFGVTKTCIDSITNVMDIDQFGVTKACIGSITNANFSVVNTVNNIQLLREVVDFKLEVKFTDCKRLCRLAKCIKLVAKQSLLLACQSNIVSEISSNELPTATDRDNNISMPDINVKNPSELTAIIRYLLTLLQIFRNISFDNLRL